MPDNKFSIGNLPLVKAFFGSQEIEKIYLGNILVYENTTQLAAPIISLSGDVLSIQEVPNAVYYDIYVDGNMTQIVGPTVTVNIQEDNTSFKSYFIIYDGRYGSPSKRVYSSYGNTHAVSGQKINCTTGYLYIEVQCTTGSAYLYFSAGATGEITLIDSSSSGRTQYLAYKVDGDGTIYCNIDYKD